jgi:hypothetical protein
MISTPFSFDDAARSVDEKIPAVQEERIEDQEADHQ